jgi:IS5 family transposase
VWVPGAATADRGYGEAKVDEELREPGVNTIVNPHKGKPVGGPPRRRARPWVPPAGQVANIRSEGGISYLKHRYGWDRSRLDAGARTWCGLRVIAHNSVEIAALIQTRQVSIHASDSYRLRDSGSRVLYGKITRRDSLRSVNLSTCVGYATRDDDRTTGVVLEMGLIDIVGRNREARRQGNDDKGYRDRRNRKREVPLD